MLVSRFFISISLSCIVTATLVLYVKTSADSSAVGPPYDDELLL